MRSQTSEHILLESEARDVPDWDRARVTHATLRCRSRLRMHRLELAIIDYYYLAVRTSRSGSARDYVLDLRFVDRSIRATKRGSWMCVLVALALAGAVIVTLSWRQHQVLLRVTTLGLAVCAGLVCVWRAAETLSLRSLHGDATLLEFTGGLGTRRATREFARKLAAHIQFAATARSQGKAEHLRDEMREHFRLKEAGVLSQEQYDAGKARILAQHTPVRQVRRS